MQALGGTVALRARVPQGAELCVQLPLAQAEAGAPTPNTLPPPSPPLA